MLIPALKWVNPALGNIKTAITATYRAIRQKHISRYPAEFAYRFNRRYDLAAMMLPLGWAALRTPPRLWRSLKYEDIYLKGYADGGEASAGVAPWTRLLQRPEVSSGAGRPNTDGRVA